MGDIMNRFRLLLKDHLRIAKILMLAYVVFVGCFVFPFGNESFPFDLMKAYLVIASYGVIGLGFAGLYGMNKERVVYIASFILTGLGMLCRYILEYGKVSNTMNFTLFNIVAYLGIIPVFIMVSYHFIARFMVKGEQ